MTLSRGPSAGRSVRGWVLTTVVTCALAGAGVAATPGLSFASTNFMEVTGGQTHSWSNFSNAGGAAGPVYPGQTAIAIDCVEQNGFRVLDGNTNWYHISGTSFYASADAFYNNGATSGGLRGTPFVDPAVPACESLPSGGGGGQPAPQVSLNQGAAAPYGYRYDITLTNFAANTVVSVNCFDSASPGGFYPFTLTTDGSGSASISDHSCYSADGPDHWVVAGGVQSNHVAWQGSAAGGGATTSPPPPQTQPVPAPAPTGPIAAGLNDHWAGYVGVSPGVTLVDASWTVPSVSCSSYGKYSEMSMWDGIDEDQSDLVQAGSDASCDSGSAKPNYTIWWESLPATEVIFGEVKAGDSIRVAITSDPSQRSWQIRLWVNGRVRLDKHFYHKGKNNTAECIAEAPTGQYYTALVHGRHKVRKLRVRHRGLRQAATTGAYHREPLADFGTATFSSCVMSSSTTENQQIAAGSLGGVSVTRYNMTGVGTSRLDGTTSSSTNASSWTETWHHTN